MSSADVPFGHARPRVLVTGGAGFIGAALVKRLLALSGDCKEVVIADMCADAPYPAAVKQGRLQHLRDFYASQTPGTPRLTILSETDVSNVATTGRLLTNGRGFDIIVHLAAQPGVRPGEQPAVAEAANVGSMVALMAGLTSLELMQRALPAAIVFTSSSSVYGDTPVPTAGWGEQLMQPGSASAPSARSEYAKQKRVCEALLERWYRVRAFNPLTAAFSVTVVRPFTVYGPWGRPDMLPLKLVAAAFNGTTAELAMNRGPDACCEIMRDFTHVDDVVEGILRAAGFSDKGADQLSSPSPAGAGMRWQRPAPSFRIINLGAGLPVPLLQVAQLLACLIGRPLAVKRRPALFEDVPVTHADASVAATELGGWTARTRLSDGLCGMATWAADAFRRSRPVRVVAVLATQVHRLDLLVHRALPSIAAQTRQPDHVVIVLDERGAAAPAALEQTRAAVARPDMRASVCLNSRTPGASGAWNSGILEAAAWAQRLGSVAAWADLYVAVLDDDDEWLPEHLEVCTGTAHRTGAQLVVTGLIRVVAVDGMVTTSSLQSIPRARELTRDAFYRGNPHIQGSNLFASVALLARAGLFGEGLPSTTDRDLLVRITALPPATVGAVCVPDTWTVRHYAEPQRGDRLSTPGSTSKAVGLRAFLRLHGPAMSAQQRTAFLQRAASIFHVDVLAGNNGAQESGAALSCGDVGAATSISDIASTVALPLAHNAENDHAIPKSCILLVGIASDASDSITVRPLLRDLARLQRESVAPRATVIVLVLENGISNSTGELYSPLAAAVREDATATGLAATVISLAQVATDAAAGALPDDEDTRAAIAAMHSNTRLPIATTRTIIQRYCYLTARGIDARMAGARRNVVPIVAAIMDDDKGLSPLYMMGEKAGGIVEPRWAGADFLWHALKARCHAGDAAVVLGRDTGAPPLPTLSCLRLQLVDVLALLQAAAACAGPDDPLPSCASMQPPGTTCLVPATIEADGYHDLSAARSDHLEAPVCPMCCTTTDGWRITALSRPPTAGQALATAQRALGEIASGAMVTRPLVQAADGMADASIASPSVQRGGCTLVFDLEALRVPNPAPSLGGARTRRSDMLWALLQTRVYGRAVVQASRLFVMHRRGTRYAPSPTSAACVQSLRDDIRGHALVTALQEALSVDRDAVGAPIRESQLPLLSPEQERVFLLAFRRRLAHRAQLAQLSLARVSGLLDAIQELASPAQLIFPDPVDAEVLEKAAWWQGTSDACSLQEAAVAVSRAFSVDALWPCPTTIEDAAPPLPLLADEISDDDLLAWVRALPGAGSSTAFQPSIDACIAIADRLREAAARATVASALSLPLTAISPGQLPCIGIGGEGVTYRVPSSSIEADILSIGQPGQGLTSLVGSAADVTVKVCDLFRARAPADGMKRLLAREHLGWSLAAADSGHGDPVSVSLPPATNHLQPWPDAPRPLASPLVGLEAPCGTPLLLRPYLDGTPYRGRHGPSLVWLLRCMRAADVSTGNLSPDNILLVTPPEQPPSNATCNRSTSAPVMPALVLVDYGFDTSSTPVTAARWRRMLLRAFLCWRWAEVKSDDVLASLLAAARDVPVEASPTAVENHMPEAAGFDAFVAGVEQDASHTEHELLISLAALVRGGLSGRGIPPRSLLDFGCGKGELLRELIRNHADDPPPGAALRLAGFDPDQSMPQRWAHDDAGARDTAAFITWLSDRSAVLAHTANPANKFDCVVCSRVLCVLPASGEEEARLLADLHTCLAPGGTLILTVCHPASSGCGCTTLQRRFPSPEAVAGNRNASAVLRKHHGLGGIRTDHYRPMGLLLRLLLRAGWQCVGQRVVASAIDLHRFERVPEVLALVCKSVIAPLWNVPWPVSPSLRVALLIKACAMDWRTLGTRVRHIVGVLEDGCAFDGGIWLVLDRRLEGFTRAFDSAATREELDGIANELQNEGMVDHVVSPTDSESELMALLDRWHGPDTASCPGATHTVMGTPLASFYEAVETLASNGVDVMLQVDCDIMLRRGGRRNRNAAGGSVPSAYITADGVGMRASDIISPALDVFTRDSGAVTVSLPIVPADSVPEWTDWTSGSNSGPWRTEVRACFLHVQRLLQARPLPWATVSSPNAPNGPLMPALSWYRALDTRLAEPGCHLRSYRGGDAGALAFIHPPNTLKMHPGAYGVIIDAAERGPVLPAGQAGNVDAPLSKTAGEGSAAAHVSWLRAPPGTLAAILPEASSWYRREDIVVVCTGRQVAPGRAARCLSSLTAQRVPLGMSWGAVIVWDGDDAAPGCWHGHEDSFNWHDANAYLAHLVEGGGMPGLRGRATLLRPRSRRGSLANTVDVIRHIVVNPLCIIALLDLDDALIGDRVFESLHAAFAFGGVDVFAGGGLRTDKAGPVRMTGVAAAVDCPVRIGEPTYAVTFDRPPRLLRGGGAVWSHLRAARKVSFDRITEEQLEREREVLPCDWVYMVPLADMAWRGATPGQALYLYEPGTHRVADHISSRETAITAILARPRSARLVPTIAVIGDAFIGRRVALPAVDGIGLPALHTVEVAKIARELGAALKQAGYRLLTGGLGGVMAAAAGGALDAPVGPPLRSYATAQAAALAAHGLTVSTCGNETAASVGLLPAMNVVGSCPAVDVPLATGLGHGRNDVVATAADAVIIIGGGAGTLWEASAAWTQRRMLIAIAGTGGTADLLAGQRVDSRRRLHSSEFAIAGRAEAWAEDCVYSATSIEHVLSLLEERLHWYRCEAMLPRTAEPW